MTAPNDRYLTMDGCAADRRRATIDTVVLAFTDMQGRLQGKRLHGRYFLDVALEHGTEGCNYLLAVDIDMNTVDGYAISSWERGYGDMEFVPRRATRSGCSPTCRPPRWCSATWSGSTTRPVLQSPRTILQHQLDRVAEKRHGGAGGHRAGVHRVRHLLRGRPPTSATAT